MTYDKVLAERIGRLLRRRSGFAEKKMFGGVGFLHHGNMCVGVWKCSLVVRLGKEQHDETMAHPHAGPFDITGRAMKGWALIEPAGIATDEALEDWVGRAAEYVATLPSKEGR